MSFIRRLYETSVLKVDCIVLQYERFDAAIVKQVQSVENPPTTNAPSSQSGGCFALLHHANIVLSKQKVGNVLGTRTRSGQGVQARNQSSKSESMWSTLWWI